MFSNQVVGSVVVGVERSSTHAQDSVRQRRREKMWAWLTLVALILCWDASMRLDERVSPPRVRTDHIGEATDVASVLVRRR